MPCGFLRGTSGEQDSRFSNKQAKLMKSQRFAPELEKLVDVTKVKMDVMKPWIATRVTELLGFEDEVLINYIYGLLDGKVVNGKEIQLAITGFMEKNAAKFMKELWTLVLSAQDNANGVPQQFLDSKEAATKKKTEEAIEESKKLEDSRSRSRSLRRSFSPCGSRSHSPSRRHRSPTPLRRRRLSPMPFRRRRSPSPPARRRSSPSPLYRRKRSRSPPVKRGRSSSRPSPPPRRPGSHKRSAREELSSDDNGSSDSDREDRKEAKRRRKEEKKRRPEETHRGEKAKHKNQERSILRPKNRNGEEA